MRILLGLVALSLAANVACTGATTARASTTASTANAQAPTQLTPQDLERRMKEIGTTFPAMRMRLMGGMTADAVKDAQQLATLFGDVERFWAQQSRADAVKWAQDARTFATEVAGAATAGDVMKATQAANNMLASCKQCHGTYREVDPAGGFRIKAGVIQ